jgi:hypothetical protein
MVDTLCLAADQLVEAGIVGPNSFKLQEPHPAYDYFPTHEHLVSELHVVLQLLDMRALHGKCPLSAKATETLQAARRSVRREPDSMKEEDAADPLAKLAAKVVRSLVDDVQCGFKYLARSYGKANSAAFRAFYDAAVAKLAACVSDALSAHVQADALATHVHADALATHVQADALAAHVQADALAGDTAGQVDDAADVAGAPCTAAQDDGPASAESGCAEDDGQDGGQHSPAAGGQAEDDSQQTAVGEDGGQRKRGRKQ